VEVEVARPEAWNSRSQSGSHISMPRAAEMSPRSMMLSDGQPKLWSRAATSRLAASSLPAIGASCDPGTRDGSTITALFMVLSAFTTRVSGSSRWICSPTLSVLQTVSVRAPSAENSSGFDTSISTLPARCSGPAARRASSDAAPAVQFSTISPNEAASEKVP
jgi:hypothetical protein